MVVKRLITFFRIHDSSLMISCSAEPERILKPSSLVMVATSTLVSLSFSSMTCLRMVMEDLMASFRVMDLWYTSCRDC